MRDETGDILKGIRNEEDDRCRKRIDLLRGEFGKGHESLTDRERLELIAFIIHNPEIEIAELFENLLSQLTFVDRAITSEHLRTV